MKRLLSMLLVLTLVLACVPVLGISAATTAAQNYKTAADTAYANLLKNFVDSDNDRIHNLVHGFTNGSHSNKLGTINYDYSEAWEQIVVMSALDTYAEGCKGTDTYNEIATIITNSMDNLISQYGNNIAKAGTAPNHAMDDTGWTLYGLLLDYKYQTYLGNTSKATAALDYAKTLFGSAYSTYYTTSLGGGMWYNSSKTNLSLYASTIALAGYDLYQITNDSSIKTKYEAIYNALESNMRREDGLYWMDKNSDGYVGADIPYNISEGGSVTYLNGNMAMAILNNRLGNTDKAKATCNGIFLYETTGFNALLNDRDAWNNTFFLGLFVKELVNTGVADQYFNNIIRTTADQILKNAVFEDGYYSAAWEGPKEPSSTGYVGAWNGTDDRNNWGVQDNQGSYGSTPNQAMTSATTAHVLMAAANLTGESATILPADFAGTGSELTSKQKVDNTRDYVLEFDLDMPHTAETTSNNTWVDRVYVKMRNVAADDCVFSRIRTYVNGSGFYQVNVTSQLVDGGSWGSESDKWSNSYETAASVDKLHVKLIWDAASGTYTEIITDRNTGAEVINWSLTAASAEFRSCTNAEVYFGRESTQDIVPANAILYYSEDDTSEEPAPSVNEGKDLTFTASDNRLVADDTADNTRDYILTYDLHMPNIETATGSGVWADESYVFIRSTQPDHYYRMKVQTFLKSSGVYQLAAAGQVYNGQTGNWTNQIFEWSPNLSAAPVDVTVSLLHTADDNYTWTISDKASGAIINTGSFASDFSTTELKQDSQCELSFQNKDAGITISNANIKYVTLENMEFTGDADWLTAQTTLDNTQDYIFSYDLNMPNIAAVTANDKWADDSYLAIRNADADHYLKLQLQAYRNGSGTYQVAPSAQTWAGSDWHNDRVFNWSGNYDAPLTDVNIKLIYTAETGDTTWIITDKASSTVLNSYTYAGTLLTDELKGCTAATVMLYRNQQNITLSNAYVIYPNAAAENGGGDTTEPTETVSVSWTGTGDWLTTTQTIDNTKTYTVRYDLELPNISAITTPNTWGDNTQFKISQGSSQFYLQLQACMKPNGKYAIFARATNGSTNAEVWSGEYTNAVDSLSVKITHDAATHTFAWTVYNRDDANAEVLSGTYDPANLADELKNGTACDVRFYRNPQTIVPANTTVTYGPITEDDGTTMDPGKNPSNFGWSSDNSFQGWESNTDGSVFHVTGESQIYKNLITDTNNFTLTATVQLLADRAYIYVLGTRIELNVNGGNGNQVFSPDTWQWLNGQGSTCTITVARIGGGKLNVVLKGKGNETTMNYELTPAEPNNTNVYLGTYGAADAYFSNVSCVGIEGQDPSAFGWKTDDGKDFAGWSSLDGINIIGMKSETEATGSGRIWRNLIDDQNNFAVKLRVVTNKSSGVVQVRGAFVEVDSRSSEAGKLRINIDGYNSYIIDAEDYTADLILMYNGTGDILVSVVGKNGNAHTYAMPVYEESNNVELKLWGGNVEFRNIAASEPAQCLRPIPFGSAVFAGSLGGNWKDLLISDIPVYQNANLTSATVEANAEAILAANGDLIVIANGAEIMVGKTADEIVAEYIALLSAVNSGKADSSVLVVAGLPYATDKVIGENGIQTIASVNAQLRAYAEANGIVYADIYSAMGSRSWTVGNDGMSLSSVGNALVEGEIISALIRSCTCLAVNGEHTLRTDLIAPVEKTNDALNAFKNASDASAMAAAIADRALGLNVTLYNMLSTDKQALVHQALLSADRSAIASFTDADALFTATVMDITRNNPANEIQLGGDKPYTIVTVGDSVTQGTSSVNQSTDAWPIRLNGILGNVQPGAYTVINKGVAGTRMCTRTDNNMYGPAGDYIDEYIVANNPDLIIVSYGFNDTNAGTTLAEFISTYNAYIDEIQQKCPNAVIVLCNVYASNYEHNRSVALEWNAAIKAMAEEQGCLYSTSYDELASPIWVLDDGVHPNNAGYRVMAHVRLRYLNAYMNLTGVTAQYQNSAINSAQLLLKDVLDLNVTVANADGCVLQVTVGSGAPYQIEAATNSVFTVKLPIHRLGESVKLELIANGEVVDSEIWTLKGYTDALRKDYGDNTEMMNLLDSLENYNTYAAYYANPNGSAPNVEAVEAVERRNMQSYKVSFVKSDASLGAVTSLYLDDACDLRIKFNAENWGGNKLLVDGTEVPVTTVGSRIVYDIADILPQNWTKLYNIKVTDADGNILCEFNYSVLSYAYVALGGAEEAAAGLNGMLKAMYLYSMAANAYQN